MTIDLKQVSKRYTRNWIIKNLTHTFHTNEVYGIRGSNGSGKSTLLNMISGYLSVSKGKIIYCSEGGNISRDSIYEHVAFAAPYILAPQDLTVREVIRFVFNFRTYIDGLNEEGFIDRLDLPSSLEYPLRDLSSGQNRRLNLALSILSDTSILLLDEPGSYLDKLSKNWFNDLLAAHLKNRCIIIASNDSDDHQLATNFLDLEI